MTRAAMKTAAWAGAASVAMTMLASTAAADAAPSSAIHTGVSASASCHVTTIYYGSRGALVKTAQKRLGHLVVDGIFGPKTRARTKSFQRSKHIVADGVIGPVTWGKLGGYPGCHTPARKAVTRWVVPHINFLSVRTGPSTRYHRVAKLTSGTQVHGTISRGWMHITSGHYKGRYVSASYLTSHRPKPAPKPKPKPPAHHTVTAWVMADSGAAGSKANIRSGPGLHYRVVGSYGPHAKVTGTIVGDWLHTSRGYVHRGTLETSTSNPSRINGKIPSGSLCKVPKAYNSSSTFAPGYTPNTQRYLNCFDLKQLNGLERAYKSHFGHYAQIDLTYRDIAEQWYWYHKFGSPRAAYPGTSNHGYAIAVDFKETDKPGEEFGWGGAGQKWLESHAGAYGFNNPFRYGTTGESYHFQFVG